MKFINLIKETFTEEDNVSLENAITPPVEENPFDDITKQYKYLKEDMLCIDRFNKRINKYKNLLSKHISLESYASSSLIDDIGSLVEELKINFKNSKLIQEIPSISLEKYKDFNDVKIATQMALNYLNEVSNVVSIEEGGVFKSAGAFVSSICSKIGRLFESKADKALRLRAEVKEKYKGSRKGEEVEFANLNKYIYSDGKLIKFSEVTKQANSSFGLADPAKGYLITKTMDILQKYDKVGAYKPMAGEYNFVNKFPLLLGYGSFRPGEGFAVDFLGGIWTLRGSRAESIIMPKKEELVALIEKAVTITSISIKQIDAMYYKLYDYGSSPDTGIEYDWNTGKTKTTTTWKPRSGNERHVIDTLYEIAACMYDILSKLLNSIFDITEFCLVKDDKVISKESIDISKEISIIGQGITNIAASLKSKFLSTVSSIVNFKSGSIENINVDDVMTDLERNKYTGKYAGHSVGSSIVKTLVYSNSKTVSWKEISRQYYDAENIFNPNNGLLLKHILECFARRDFCLDKQFNPVMLSNVVLGAGKYVKDPDCLLKGRYSFDGNNASEIIGPTVGEFNNLLGVLKRKYIEYQKQSSIDVWASQIERFIKVNSNNLNDQEKATIIEVSRKCSIDAFSLEQRAFSAAVTLSAIILETDNM